MHDPREHAATRDSSASLPLCCQAWLAEASRGLHRRPATGRPRRGALAQAVTAREALRRTSGPAPADHLSPTPPGLAPQATEGATASRALRR